MEQPDRDRHDDPGTRKAGDRGVQVPEDKSGWHRWDEDTAFWIIAE